MVIQRLDTILDVSRRTRVNFDRAVKHLMIAINLGYEDSMTLLRTFYKKGRVTKEKLLAAILAYQAAVDATKSVERDAETQLMRGK